MKVATSRGARAFGVRVTEFMLGLPGPNIGFTWRGIEVRRHGGSLGGYAKVCAAWSRAPKTRILKDALAFAYANGTVYTDDVAEKMDITLDEAIEALYVLEEWGCLVGPKKTDEHNVFRTRTFKDKRKGIDLAEGHPCPFDDAHEPLPGRTCANLSCAAVLEALRHSARGHFHESAVRDCGVCAHLFGVRHRYGERGGRSGASCECRRGNRH